MNRLFGLSPYEKQRIDSSFAFILEFQTIIADFETGTRHLIISMNRPVLIKSGIRSAPFREQTQILDPLSGLDRIAPGFGGGH